MQVPTVYSENDHHRLLPPRYLWPESCLPAKRLILLRLARPASPIQQYTTNPGFLVYLCLKACLLLLVYLCVKACLLFVVCETLPLSPCLPVCETLTPFFSSAVCGNLASLLNSEVSSCYP